MFADFKSIRHVYKILQIKHFLPSDQKRFERLVEKMSPFNQIPLEAISLYRKSLEMSGKGNYESALKYLSNAVMIAPQFATAICEMGHCYEKLGRFPEAVSKFDKVIRMHPTHGEAEVNKNRVMEKIRSDK